jgi:hypothetical protein
MNSEVGPAVVPYERNYGAAWMRKSELRYNSETVIRERIYLTNSAPYFKTKNGRFALFKCVADFSRFFKKTWY